VLQAWERHRVNDVAGLGTTPMWLSMSPAWGPGRWRRIRRARQGSRMMVQRLQGGLDDCAGSGKVNDGARTTREHIDY
jgi:hypothetical protein